jgi:hypothetical protein
VKPRLPIRGSAPWADDAIPLGEPPPPVLTRACKRCTRPLSRFNYSLICAGCRSLPVPHPRTRPEFTCPDCGGFKWHRSVRCHECNTELHASLTRSKSCPHCGGPKGPDSKMCIDCRKRERSEKKS